ncbi:MAG: rod shape-determining protein MreD [Alphaproteobacteria bacterium]|nr:rod shape-determining protein MreD [Alphaproteobacteria bacterium]
MLWSRLDLVARSLTPMAITLLLAVISVLPMQIPSFGAVSPVLSLMAVYYWSIFRPDLMPSVAVFGAGLFQDILSGTPLGAFALVFLLVRLTVVSRRRFFIGNSFVVMWWGFMLVAVGSQALVWEITSLLSMTLISPSGVAFQVFLTLSLFPCFAWLFFRAQQAFLRQS